MAQWLKKGKCSIKQPSMIILPDETTLRDSEQASAISAANDKVCEILVCMGSAPNNPSSSSRKRKRSGQYGIYSPEVRLSIAEYCMDNGPVKMARHFSSKHGWPVNESTVRNMKNMLICQVQGERCFVLRCQDHPVEDQSCCQQRSTILLRNL